MRRASRRRQEQQQMAVAASNWCSWRSARAARSCHSRAPIASRPPPASSSPVRTAHAEAEAECAVASWVCAVRRVFVAAAR